jgi:hypothetical protein
VQIILDNEETWSLMSLMVSQMIDRAGLSSEGKAALRKWRTERGEGSAELADLTVEFNEAIGSTLDEKTTRLIRRRGRYVSSREDA